MDEKKIGLLSAVSIGVGGMVGGGIFAVLGLAVQLAAGGTYIAFAIAGFIAVLTSYSYARLSVAYPSQGGTVEFLNQAFGTGVFTGGLNILLWFNYIVMLSLYAYAFGSYGSTFFASALQPLMKHVLISAVIVVFTGLNILGSRAVGEAEEWIVGVKIGILLLFLVFGLGRVDMTKLKPATWAPAFRLVTGGMVIFVAYEGFELIANTASDMKNPGKNIPRSYGIAVGFVVLLYILIAVVTLGVLSVPAVVQAKDYALAAAAKPFMGSLGFTIITIAALMSTASAINATLYGASRVSFIIAKDGELPVSLERKIWNKPIEGLLITAGITLAAANLFDLSSIAMMGSAGFIIVFAAVNAANLRLFRRTHSLWWLPLLGTAACFAALVLLLAQTAMENPWKVAIPAVILLMSFLIEIAYRRVTGRTLKQVFPSRKSG
jgi:amino acid transporter